MKKIIKSTLLASAFVTLMFVSAQNVFASGAYGSDVIINQETHQTVDAGLADSLPQIGTALLAISGLATTSILLQKTK